MDLLKKHLESRYKAESKVRNFKTLEFFNGSCSLRWLTRWPPGVDGQLKETIILLSL
jgi:hypothetical protein